MLTAINIMFLLLPKILSQCMDVVCITFEGLERRGKAQERGVYFNYSW